MNFAIAAVTAFAVASLLWFAARRIQWLREYLAIVSLFVVFFGLWGYLEYRNPTPNFGTWGEKRRPSASSTAVDLPAVGHFAVDRKTGQVDGVVIATRYSTTTMGGKTGPGVQVRFNEGFTPWFLAEDAYERWQFTADRGGRDNSPLALGAKPVAVESPAPQPGQKIYDKDAGRYAGKILETEVLRGAHVEFFNGKREWVHLADLESKWTVR